MSAKAHFLLLLWTLASSVGSADVTLNDSHLWRRAKLVAGGQQVWAFQASHQQYTDRFGASGSSQPLGQAYGRTLTWKQLLAADPSGAAEMQDYMARHNVNGNDVAASADYQVQRQETALSADWAYGLTNLWMIGFQMPLTYRQTRVSSKVGMTPTLAQGVAVSAKRQSKTLLGLPQQNVRKRVADLANAQLNESGYDGVPEQKETWDWGDISLLSQFELASTYRWTWACQQMVRFPTARNPSVADYLQTNSDDGQVDIGVTSMLDYHQRHWITGLRLGYVAQLPDSVRMHVPSDPRQIDPSVHRDLGDYGFASLDTEYRVSRRFGFDLEYSYLKKAADRFRGESQDGTDYSTLGRNTDQQLHETRAGLQYRLGDASSRSGVENKWVASLGYTYPWIGRNSVDASKTSLELITYF